VIYAPSNGRSVSGTVQVLGRAAVDDFEQYILEYGEGPSPGEWVNIITAPVERELGILGVWNTSGLDPGGYTLRLTVVDEDGQTYVSSVVVSVGN
jgi:hypothetical protein